MGREMRYAILILSVILLYALWWNLEYQEGTFRGTADHYLQNYHGYPEPLYALMVWAGVESGNVYTFLWWLGLALTLATVPIFYKTFNLAPDWWHSILFIPAIAVLATRSSQGPVVLLFLLAYRFFKERLLWESALMSTLAGFFRSELLLMPLLFGVLGRRREFILLPILAIGIWWGISGYPVKSNGLAVVYINLGFSQDNPYGSVATDSVAYKVASQWNGNPDAWHPDNGKIFLWRILAKVREYPLYFTIDSLRKIGRFFVTRLWVGDEHMGRFGIVFKVARVLFLILLWIPFFQKRVLDADSLMLSTYVISWLIIGAFVGGTAVLNASYLLMLGYAWQRFDHYGSD